MSPAGRKLTLHLDGGSRGNPGPAGAGVVIRESDTGQPLHEAGYCLGRMTNNAAEYHALLHGLTLAVQLAPQRLTIYSDSELLVNQITGQYKVKSQDLKPLFEKAQGKLLSLDDWSIQHVRREGNARADALANAAMDAGDDLIERDAFAESGEAAERHNAPASQAAPSAETSTKRSWQVELVEPARCVLGEPEQQCFRLGPTTPAGLCVHAAAAVFASDPLAWPENRTVLETQCDRCHAGLRIRLNQDG